jgi:hypothetical protein
MDHVSWKDRVSEATESHPLLGFLRCRLGDLSQTDPQAMGPHRTTMIDEERDVGRSNSPGAHLLRQSGKAGGSLPRIDTPARPFSRSARPGPLAPLSGGYLRLRSRSNDHDRAHHEPNSVRRLRPLDGEGHDHLQAPSRCTEQAQDRSEGDGRDFHDAFVAAMAAGPRARLQDLLRVEPTKLGPPSDF